MADSTLTIKILADSQDAERGMSKVNEKAGGMGQAFQNAAAMAATFLAAKAVQAVTQFVGDSIRAFSDLEQSVGGTKAVFGDASGAIDKFAVGSAQAIGLSEAEFRTATTSIGGQLKRMTGDVNLAADKSIVLTQVAADLAATYGGTTAEAVAALGSAFRGEADPAERFNLNLKVSAVNAKAVEMGLAASTSKVDDNAKAQATLALIMEQSADAQGQFAREADTLAGKTQRLNAEFENSKAAFGQGLGAVLVALMPLLQDASKTVGILGTMFADLVGAISPAESAIQQFEIHTGQAADTLAALVTIQRESGESFDSLIGLMSLTADQLVPLTDNQKSYLEAVGYTREEIEALDDMLADEFMSVTEDARDHGLDYITEGFEATGDASDDMSQKVKRNLNTFSDALSSLTEQSNRTWTDVADDVEEYITGFQELPEKGQITIDEFMSNINDRLARWTQFEEDLKTIAAGGNQALVDELRRGGPDVAGAIASQFAGNPGKAAAANAAVSTGEAYALGVAQGINNQGRAVRDAMTGVVRRADDYVRKQFGISSPSKAFAERVGKPISEGIAKGIEDAGEDVSLSTAGVVGGAAGGLPRGTGGGGGGTGASTVINITVNADMGSDGYQIGKRIIEAIQEYQRIAGPSDIDVRFK